MIDSPTGSRGRVKPAPEKALPPIASNPSGGERGQRFNAGPVAGIEAR
jgi:hypothetical protein